MEISFKGVLPFLLQHEDPFGIACEVLSVTSCRFKNQSIRPQERMHPSCTEFRTVRLPSFIPRNAPPRAHQQLSSSGQNRRGKVLQLQSTNQFQTHEVGRTCQHSESPCPTRQKPKRQ